jgi:glucokinase
MYYVGIDIGGMSIKTGIVNKSGEIVIQSAIVTESVKPELLMQKVGAQINELLSNSGIQLSQIKGIGVGCPGAINGKAGTVIYSSNLPLFEGFNLKSCLEEITGKPV